MYIAKIDSVKLFINYEIVRNTEISIIILSTRSYFLHDFILHFDPDDVKKLRSIL